MIRLWITYYPEKNSKRKKELDNAILSNCKNKHIGQIVVLNEKGIIENKNSKISIIDIDSRPTYRDFFAHINQRRTPDDINIIANTDIVLDENISSLNYFVFENKCFALSRWEYNLDGSIKLFNRNDSQDAWFFRGKINNVFGEFPLGVPRCDNRLLYELQSAGYKVLNPAFSIKSYHLHAGKKQEYSLKELDHFVPGPYRYLYASNLYSLRQTLLFNAMHTYRLSHYKYDRKKVNQWFPVRIVRKLLKIFANYELPLIGYK